MDLANRIIKGKKVEVGELSAIEGWSLLRKLTAMFGPAIADISEGSASGMVVATLFEKLTEDEMFKIIGKLTEVVFVDGAKWNNNHLKDYMFTFEVLGFVLETNYKDFFSLLKENLAGLLKDQNPA